jgi:hypothetical protein
MILTMDHDHDDDHSQVRGHVGVWDFDRAVEATGAAKPENVLPTTMLLMLLLRMRMMIMMMMLMMV